MIRRRSEGQNDAEINPLTRPGENDTVILGILGRILHLCNDIEGIESKIRINGGCLPQPTVEDLVVVTVLLEDARNRSITKQKGKADCWCHCHG